jgi:hypothetical protein
MTALSALSEGKSKPVTYFTQGHGEFDLNNSDASRLDEGSGALKSRLEKRNYDVKPLELGAANPKVPEDASIVVIARPSIPFAPAAIDALRNYMKPADPTKKKGKLFILFDVVLTAENKMVRTGLEDFLKEFNVDVGNERVLSLPSISDNPAQVIVLFNPELGPENPLLATFGRQMIPLYNVRPVKPISAPPGGPPGSELRAESLLIAPASVGIWAEADLQADPARIINDLQKLSPQELENKLSKQPIPVAVVVSESAASADPHAFMRPQAGQTPRLAIFGDATLACNKFTSDRRGNTLQYEVIANTMDWLREKPSNIGIEPKTRNVFSIDTANTSLSRMILLPAALMLLGILGLGTGVWIVRRQ